MNLPSLTFLSLNGNQLTRIPKVLKHFPRLLQLHLHLNKLTDCRELCRASFSRLEVLDLGNNKLKELPVALVYYLASLSLLNLVNNDLTQVPALLGLHKAIKTVQLEGNPLKAIRRPIIEKGTEAVLRYLRDKYVEGARENLVEEWALEMEQEAAMYGGRQGDYGYEGKRYGYQQEAYRGELPKEPQAAVGREMNLEEFQAQKSQQRAVYEEQKFHGADPYHVQGNVQDHIQQQMIYHQAQLAQLQQRMAPQTQPFPQDFHQQLTLNPSPIPQPQPQQPAAPSLSQPSSQDSVAEERLALDQQINALQKEIDTNFSLSKNQVMEKKKLLNQLIAKKNRL